MSAVHPRLRGELQHQIMERPKFRGSSPLARGTQKLNRQRKSFSRFIPACAGNSMLVQTARGSVSVHPRLRGELATTVMSAPVCNGSSPLARGTRQRHSQQTSRHRFIPACAGNSYPKANTNTPPTVHPRLRGELAGFFVADFEDFGSSPLARGTQPRKRIFCPVSWFIPACAGNSLKWL